MALKPFVSGTSNDRFYKNYRKPVIPVTVFVSGGIKHQSTEITLRNEDGATFDLVLSNEDVALLLIQLQS